MIVHAQNKDSIKKNPIRINISTQQSNRIQSKHTKNQSYFYTLTTSHLKKGGTHFHLQQQQKRSKSSLNQGDASLVKKTTKHWWDRSQKRNERKHISRSWTARTRTVRMSMLTVIDRFKTIPAKILRMFFAETEKPILKFKKSQHSPGKEQSWRIITVWLQNLQPSCSNQSSEVSVGGSVC